MIVDNDLLSIQHSRIIAENAFEAQKLLADFSQEQLDCIIERVADGMLEHLPELAQLCVQETGSGKWQDKLNKSSYVCRNVRASLGSKVCVGVLSEDPEKGLVEIGIPYGVIVALCPMTSPVSTTIFKTLLAIKTGNAILFSPHPAAQRTITRTLELLIGLAEQNGIPRGCIAMLEPVSKAGTCELMHHPLVSILLLTGVPGMLPQARTTGKPLIYGGTGNGPAFIERSADLKQAVRDIVSSKIFDFGLAPAAEQSIVVDTPVALEVRRLLTENGAYFMTDEQADRLGRLLFCPDGRHRKGMIGQPVEVLARRAGFTVPADTTLLIADRKHISHRDLYSRELLAPVLALYEEDDWQNGCEKCIELLIFERNAHTMVIHSNNEEVIRQFALKKPVGRLLVNTPACFGAMGASTDLEPSMTLGSGSAGHGISADNISPHHLVYTRRVARGMRLVERLAATTNETEETRIGVKLAADTAATLQTILTEVIKTLADPADR